MSDDESAEGAMDANPRPVTLLGLDGVSWSFVEELLDNADVPALAGLVNRSARGVTKSTIPCLTCPALPAMYTGMNPGNLGIFEFIKPNGDIVTYDDITYPAIWDYLESMNENVVVSAMRTTHPAPQVNGAFISDVLSPEEEPEFVTPSSERERGERFHQLRDELEQQKKTGLDDDLLSTFVKMNAERSEVMLELLDEYDPAFACLWFGLADGVQHYFWDDRESLYEFFEAFDPYLSDILDSRDGDIVVVGDHGFGPTRDYQFHLNEALRREGYLELAGGPVQRAFTKAAYWFSETVMTDELKRTVLGVLDRFRNLTDNDSGGEQDNNLNDIVITPFDDLPGIDWNATVAHASTRKGWGINIVKDSTTTDIDELRREVIAALDSLQTPHGNPVIKDAWFGEELYPGRYVDQVPDIVILADDHVRPRPSIFGKLFTDMNPGNYVGAHDSAREAVFMAAGDSIDPETTVGDINIWDLTPLLLNRMGLPVPERVDGNVPKALRRDDTTTNRYPVEHVRIDKGISQLDTTKL
jgi:predicted AlkP superfamily phosphohydrolase/phosphomutase